MDVASIVLSSLSLVAALLSPVVIAVAYFINRINHSQCCGGEADLSPASQPVPQPVSVLK